MKKIVIIGVYFGKLPSNIFLWLKSCKYNSTIDFKLFTDQNIEYKAENIEIISMNFNELNNLMKRKLGKEFNISSPYKCCDFRPAYGIIFEDYIRQYDFWGHCDLDMIFGDIRKYINEEILEHYDKILPLGHLSLYRNTITVNNRFKDNGSKLGTYKNIYKNYENVAFDETFGIAQIYDVHNYPFYKERIFADIASTTKRFKLARKDKNYNYQIFYWEKGHVYRAYYIDNEIKIDEFVYIHFQKRKNMINNVSNDSSAFYICSSGFINKNEERLTIDIIKKYNDYPGFLFEKIENIKFKIKYIITRIKKKLRKTRYYEYEK